jgi:2-dehydro-3-deoxygalactonokinase
MHNKSFISVDWGTSNLRIRLVSIPTLDIIEEISSNNGIKTIYQKWLLEGGDREMFFLNFLQNQLLQFTSQLVPSMKVIVSGMASSSIGLRELPYAYLPIATSGEGLNIKSIKSDDLLLISGVRSDSDVIRGEETQLVGLFEEDDNHQKLIFILPGTHSKHVYCEHGMIVNCKTYMTGELFEVIAKHTILNSSIEQGTRIEPQWEAFEAGVKKAQNGNSLLNSLFKIRTNIVFEEMNHVENYYYLSGLLIGDEIKSLVSYPSDKIKLCAGGKLYELYKRAIDIIGLSAKTHVVNKETADKAVVLGQFRILKQSQIKVE